MTSSSAQRLLRLLAPKSIAVIGGTEAARVVRQCDLLGFEGPIWPVSKSRDEVHGHACFKRLEDLPQAPDATFIAVPREPTIEIVASLREMGAGGAVCYASGFAEIGADGAALQDDLAAAAGDMPIVGPNCYGVINLIERAALWPDNHGGRPTERGVAIVTQSGNMGLNFTMQRGAMPLAYLLSLGNQAVTTVNDCLEALLADSRVTAIGLHVEGIGDLVRFSENAIAARERGIPIVAFKTGRSEKGARATVSHTSTLSGSDALYDALFVRFGIARVYSVPAFIETLKLVSCAPRLPGRRIASLSCSGGEASLMADRCEAYGLDVPDLAPDHAARVGATLHDYVDVTNPLDYHTFIWGERELARATFSAMMSGGFDLTFLVLDMPYLETSDLTLWFVMLDEYIAAAKENGALAAVVSSLPESLPEDTARWLLDNGIIPFMGIEEALAASAGSATIAESWAGADPEPLLAPVPVAQDAQVLDEWHSKTRLAAAGIATPPGRIVDTKDAAKAAAEIGYPVVAKAVASTLAHKSDAGGVKLGLRDAGAVEEAAEALSALSDRTLIERMVDDGVAELLIGIAHDPQFGLHAIIGAGGTQVELWRDSAIVLLPATRAQIEKALRSLRAFALLDGFRGKPQGDIDAAVAAIESVCVYATDNRDTLAELDINPLIVRPRGKGAVAADALIRTA